MRASEDQAETINCLPPADRRRNREDEQRLGNLYLIVYKLGLGRLGTALPNGLDCD